MRSSSSTHAARTKRLGWLATAVFLELNGVTITGASNDDVYELVMEVAGGHPAVEEIAVRLRDLTVPA